MLFIAIVGKRFSIGRRRCADKRGDWSWAGRDYNWWGERWGKKIDCTALVGLDVLTSVALFVCVYLLSVC